MRKKIQFWLCGVFVCCFFGTNAQTGDFLKTTDSLEIHIQYDQAFLIHTVAKGQTLYSISRFYNVPLDDITYFNPGLAGTALNITQQIKIPLSTEVIVKQWVPGFKIVNHAPVFYRVKSGETLYKLANYYFKQPMETLKSRNHLINDALSQNQLVHVGWFPLVGIPDSLSHKTGTEGVLTPVLQKLRNRFERAQTSKQKIKEEGVAYWQRDEENTSTALYVLHREAAIGSVIRIKNPLNRRVLYAQVIGRIPESSFARNVTVILSPALANALGAINSKFSVRIEFLR